MCVCMCVCVCGRNKLEVSTTLASPHIRSFCTMPVHMHTHILMHIHTHTHTLIPFEDHKSTGLKVDITHYDNGQYPLSAQSVHGAVLKHQRRDVQLLTHDVQLKAPIQAGPQRVAGRADVEAGVRTLHVAQHKL